MVGLFHFGDQNPAAYKIIFNFIFWGWGVGRGRGNALPPSLSPTPPAHGWPPAPGSAAELGRPEIFIVVFCPYTQGSFVDPRLVSVSHFIKKGSALSVDLPKSKKNLKFGGSGPVLGPVGTRIRARLPAQCRLQQKLISPANRF